MSKHRRNTDSEKSFSKNPQDMQKESYVFVKYSEIMDLRQSASAASIALSQIAKSLADIKLMFMRPEIGEKLLQRLMDMSDTRLSLQLHNKILEAEESESDMAMTLKSIVSHSVAWPIGTIKKSQKR